MVHDGRILEKPESEEELRMNIRGFAVTPAQTGMIDLCMGETYGDVMC